MRGAAEVTGQIVGAAAAIAAIGGLIGLLIVELATSKSAMTGIGWGMVITGGLVGFITGQSGSPSERMVRGRTNSIMFYGRNPLMPQSPLQFALGGVVAFGAGVALLVLTY